MDARLKTIVSNALKLKPEEIAPEVSRETCKAWTSLAHLLLITQIESVFGIQLATAQVVSVRTIADLEKVVASASDTSGGAPLKVSLHHPAVTLAPRVRLPEGVKPVALVTGSGRGIGAETTRALARRGFSVVVHYLGQEASARMLQETLVADGVDAILVMADIGKMEERHQLFGAIDKRWGRLDVLVNNAAPPIRPFPLEELPADELQVQFNAHVAVPLAVSRQFLPLLKKSGGASIINVLSIFIHGMPPEGLAAYVAAKSALAGLTRSMAKEWAKYNIRVNAITPGITRTALSRGMDPAVVDEHTKKTPIGRILEPAEVGEAIARLAWDESEHETGAEIVLDGGSASR